MDAPFAGRVIMVSKEKHVPYDRPILSKVSVLIKVLYFAKFFCFLVIAVYFLLGLHRLCANQRFINNTTVKTNLYPFILVP